MPVNWGAFKSDLTSYYAGKSAANEAAAAQKIANMYDAAAKTAKVNLTQCKLIDNGNKDRFYPVILQGFIVQNQFRREAPHRLSVLHGIMPS